VKVLVKKFSSGVRLGWDDVWNSARVSDSPRRTRHAAAVMFETGAVAWDVAGGVGGRDAVVFAAVVIAADRPEYRRHQRGWRRG
jgi:hypothetical protein